MQVLNQEIHWVSNVAITCNIPSQSGGKSSCMVMFLNVLLVCFKNYHVERFLGFPFKFSVV